MMDNLARNMVDVIHETGIVGPMEGGTVTVRTDTGSYRAKRAVSCLVAPQPGDRVTLALTRAGAYVMGVLERGSASETGITITVDGDLELALGGRFGVTASELALHAPEARVAIGRTTLVGQLLVSQIERVKQVASSVDQIAERFSQTVERCYRFVAKHDQLRAETIDYKAEKTLGLHAQNAMLTAQKLIKVDGDQIHLG
jgi:hypothetical protein